MRFLLACDHLRQIPALCVFLNQLFSLLVPLCAYQISSAFPHLLSRSKTLIPQRLTALNSDNPPRLWLAPPILLSGSPARSKSAAKRYPVFFSGFYPFSCIDSPYSNRNISTGSSLAASRAGKIVATNAIPIAAVAIHNPSSKLG